MKTFLSLALGVALCAPAFAQKMGMSNANAPTMQQSMTMGDAKIALNYTAITWAQGKMMTALMDKEKGAKRRQQVNETAKSSPLAELDTSVDLMCGQTKIPAGDYKVGFTINEELKWQLNLMNGDKAPIVVDLPLMEMGDHEHKNLVMSLYAADNGKAGCYIAFGKHGGMLELAPAQSKG